MSHRLMTTVLVPLCALAAPGLAAAEEPAPVSLSGFVDTSLLIPAAGYPDGQKGVTLGLDQVELDVIAKPLEGVTVRADLNWFPAAAVDGFDDIVEQGFVKVAFAGGLFLQAGKVNAPIGVELPDPVDMYQFSNGLLFSYATPTHLTGFFAGYDSESVQAQLFVTNDWDTPSTPGDATGGARFAYLFGAGSGVGLSAIYGPFNADDARFVIDVDLTLALGDLTLWAEGNLNRVGSTQAVGFMAKANYAFGDHSATLRMSYLKSDDAVGDFGASDLELTGAWNFPIAAGVGGVCELRADLPDVGDTRLTAVFELTGHFE
ncbi:MAG: hypothetical protein CVU56_00505 [Deltaproteobacteria bacterium HGW-Deltaproteobacteria-14]|nr:MAG: hypothetical protein CVU56_00505 [Deltaproteobacteria bacterium HGW-Deltaproteobacteria-14]